MDPQESMGALLERARGGDRQAFDMLVTECTGHVQSFLRVHAGTRLQQRVEVEDLVQETFLRAYQAIEGFRGQSAGSFRCWLRTIADRVVQDHLRRLGRKEAEISLERQCASDGSEPWGLLQPARAPDLTASKHLVQNERLDRLEKALSLLSPDHRKVILLARIRGLPIKEVAREMGRSPEAASMLLFRALMSLKAAFGGTESLRLPPDRSLEEEIDTHDGERP
ncbi:MAG: sigma-70 family RNA polymerase sigma factor [Planctomycetes bacterium]|nr:sigma-70 family RNA polymerase sigma factor [Planctomycetota bacterium]